MTIYQVTLNQNVQIKRATYGPGAVVEVDERTYAELKYHKAFEHAAEVQGDEQKQGEQTPAATLLETLPGYKNITADDIKEQLTLREIPFDTNDKSELYELLKTAMENAESGE